MVIEGFAATVQANAMRPIEYRADVTYMQALRCVEYRMPPTDHMKRSCYACALGLWYGLAGVAATHHLFLSSENDEEFAVRAMAEAWGSLVEEHFRWSVAARFPFDSPFDLPELMGRMALEPIYEYLPMYRRLYPLDLALPQVATDFLHHHVSTARDGWSWLRRSKASSCFKGIANRSVKYALNFFERQQAGLEEVPEIALLDE